MGMRSLRALPVSATMPSTISLIPLSHRVSAGIPHLHWPDWLFLVNVFPHHFPMLDMFFHDQVRDFWRDFHIGHSFLVRDKHQYHWLEGIDAQVAGLADTDVFKLVFLDVAQDGMQCLS